ncbi:DNA-binding transcriptional LysR family regulator [Rhizobium leguminosarum]|uniref:DNA-binding transcriptional LysR family regulator n=1 Tax=Rhizobium leguminosarum TaxID=384 RepID=A0AAE2MH04_RHILE|nr:MULTISPECIES: LysR family transcriptional regulator [Rhizobium]MBB4289193.1 DNA-binding transcriptional LysR family regulator [Rhizobium leguminosarum]MBB4294713.1 DNA-binding transcriptional LysR family regulator [Rhizobium leguminosarum]MBB4306107.1 DNA-binding transcriptional LysR family regulator [Rhizobium leguminosarum]MBB4418314.1 DNA-binding transcriptional LysR family regulator [Rhizobium leguminosarum]MBB4433159.1 DNA-binding transcriptional LysR family regulator [Rhizobium espera
MKDASWDDLQLFFHVATGGGLSAAAARTGISAPTIGRRMLVLERATGRSLFTRSPTGYLLAKDGQELLDRVRLMQDAARAISDWRGEVLTLPIVSTAADSWTSRFIADHLSSVWTPKDSFRMCYKTCDTGVDFTYREAHIAIRHSRPESGNVAIRPSGNVAHAAYQAADYDAANCNWISLGTDTAITPADKWTFEQPDYWITSWTNTPHMLFHLIRGGAGRGVLPCFIGDQERKLVRADPLIDELTYDMWIVAHDDERQRPEVRIVIDRLAALFAGHEDLFAGQRPLA